MENKPEKEPVFIVKASHDDLAELDGVFPQTEQKINEFRLATQNDDSAQYLLAKDLKNKIVGKLYLKFFGSTDAVAKEKILNCPDLENIEIIPRLRGQGVGTKLIQQAEDLCKEKGFHKVGLGVSIENHEARKLYERLGYKDAGLGELDISFMWRAKPDEPEQEIHEKVIYMTKTI